MLCGAGCNVEFWTRVLDGRNWNFFSCDKFRSRLLCQRFAVMQYAQAARELHEFAGLKQVLRIFRTTGQFRLLRGIRLINEQAAGAQGFHYLRKNTSLEIAEHHYDFESGGKLDLRSLEVSEIIYYKVNVGRERPGILPRLFDSGLGDIDEGDIPALLDHPDGVPSGSSCEIKRAASVRKQRPNVFSESVGQEGIGVNLRAQIRAQIRARIRRARTQRA